MRVASHVMSKAAMDIAGTLSNYFDSQANINTVKMHAESIAIISHETHLAIMATTKKIEICLAVIAIMINEHEMIDTSALEHD